MPIKKDKHFGFRIDDELHYKIFYIAGAEGRSGTGQIIYYLRKCVAEYEKKNGVIEVPNE